MMIRRAVIDAIGGFDENYFLYFEETDFCLRAKRAGFSTWYVPESRVMHILGQSTKVTEIRELPKRLPGYWYDSRRRYFATAHGLAYAMAVDLVAVIAHALGSLKRLLQRRSEYGIPDVIGDLLAHSAWHAKNRDVPPIKHFAPSS